MSGDGTTGELHGRTALVAGDVGRIPGVVPGLLEAGAEVHVQLQDDAEYAAVQAVSDPRCRVVRTPVRTFAEGTDLVAGVRPDLLVLPGPVPARAALLAGDEDGFAAQLTHELKRSVALARATARHLVAAGRPGAVVTFAPADTFTAAGPMKSVVGAAMLSLTSALAASLADSAVRANCVVLDRSATGGDLALNLGGLVRYLAGGELTGRFLYCGPRDVGIFAMPMLVEGAHVRLRLGEGDLAALIEPLTNIGRDAS